MSKLIAFGFADRVGKTTATDYLCETYGATPLYIGDHLRKISREILPSFFDPYSEAFKDNMITVDYNGRQLLRDLAELGNKYFGDAWLMHSAGLSTQLAKGHVVVADLRTAGQAMAISRLGGLVVGIRSIRAGNYIPPSMYEYCHVVIDNDRDEESFLQSIDACWHIASDI